MTIVCITGMHRSGTSIITRLLNLSGIYLGEEKDMMARHPQNPEGFWENLQFVEINNEVLSIQSGSWDVPPAINNDLWNHPQTPELLIKANQVIKKFPKNKTWGWKDPRNSLTFPFWKKIVPAMKLVICLRNPLEVEKSLIKRNNFSSEKAFNLWFEYNNRLLNYTKSQSAIITHYDAYFYDPLSELRRVTEFLGITVSNEQAIQCINAITLPLRSTKFSFEEVNKKAPSNIIKLYKTLCNQSGPNYQSYAQKTNTSKRKKIYQSKKPDELARLLSLELLERKKISFENEASLSSQIKAKEKAISEKEKVIAENEKELLVKSQSLIASTEKFKELQEQLDMITSSRLWRFAQKLAKIRVYIIPYGSRRERILNMVFKNKMRKT